MLNVKFLLCLLFVLLYKVGSGSQSFHDSAVTVDWILTHTCITAFFNLGHFYVVAWVLIVVWKIRLIDINFLHWVVIMVVAWVEQDVLARGVLIRIPLVLKFECCSLTRLSIQWGLKLLLILVSFAFYDVVLRSLMRRVSQMNRRFVRLFVTI